MANVYVVLRDVRQGRLFVFHLCNSLGLKDREARHPLYNPHVSSRAGPSPPA